MSTWKTWLDIVAEDDPQKAYLSTGFCGCPRSTKFEVRGSSITPADKWDAEDAKIRHAELASVAACHRNTRVLSFDEIQKKNALDTMALSGDNTVVKLYPLNRQEPEVYPPGHGIPQWRLTDGVKRTGSILGTLLFRIDPGSPLPWIK